MNSTDSKGQERTDSTVGRRPPGVRTFPWKQLLTSGGVLSVLVWRVPRASLRTAFQHMQPESLCLAAVSFGILLLIRTYKWHGLMVVTSKRRLRVSLRSLFGGFALGLITPGRLGELGRCVFVRKNERAEVAVLNLLDRLLDFWSLLTLVSISLFLLTSRLTAIFGFVVWLASIPVVLEFPKLVAHLARWAHKSTHFNEHFFKPVEQMPLVSVPRFAALSLCAMGVELTSFYFLLKAFSPTEFSTALATYPYIVLAGDLPISFGGIGVRESVAASLLSPYAVTSGAAVGATLVWFVFAVLIPAALGAAWLVAERVRGAMRKPRESLVRSAL
jgi:glycosyltransferase 2 family protein